MWKDIHIHPDARLYRPIFNGQLLEGCFAANEEECWVDIHILGIDNKPFYNPLIDDVATIRLWGYVELVSPEKEIPPS
jgi:hypothetical protein